MQDKYALLCVIEICLCRQSMCGRKLWAILRR